MKSQEQVNVQSGLHKYTGDPTHLKLRVVFTDLGLLTKRPTVARQQRRTAYNQSHHDESEKDAHLQASYLLSRSRRKDAGWTIQPDKKHSPTGNNNVSSLSSCLRQNGFALSVVSEQTSRIACSNCKCRIGAKSNGTNNHDYKDDDEDDFVRKLAKSVRLDGDKMSGSTDVLLKQQRLQSPQQQQPTSAARSDQSEQQDVRVNMIKDLLIRNRQFKRNDKRNMNLFERKRASNWKDTSAMTSDVSNNTNNGANNNLLMRTQARKLPTTNLNNRVDMTLSTTTTTSNTSTAIRSTVSHQDICNNMRNHYWPPYMPCHCSRHLAYPSRRRPSRDIEDRDNISLSSSSSSSSSSSTSSACCSCFDSRNNQAANQQDNCCNISRISTAKIDGHNSLAACNCRCRCSELRRRYKCWQILNSARVPLSRELPDNFVVLNQRNDTLGRNNDYHRNDKTTAKFDQRQSDNRIDDKIIDGQLSTATSSSLLAPDSLDDRNLSKDKYLDLVLSDLMVDMDNGTVGGGDKMNEQDNSCDELAEKLARLVLNQQDNQLRAAQGGDGGVVGASGGLAEGSSGGVLPDQLAYRRHVSDDGEVSNPIQLEQERRLGKATKSSSPLSTGCNCHDAHGETLYIIMEKYEPLAVSLAPRDANHGTSLSSQINNLDDDDTDNDDNYDNIGGDDEDENDESVDVLSGKENSGCTDKRLVGDGIRANTRRAKNHGLSTIEQRSFTQEHALPFWRRHDRSWRQMQQAAGINTTTYSSRFGRQDRSQSNLDDGDTKVISSNDVQLTYGDDEHDDGVNINTYDSAGNSIATTSVRGIDDDSALVKSKSDNGEEIDDGGKLSPSKVGPGEPGSKAMTPSDRTKKPRQLQLQRPRRLQKEDSGQSICLAIIVIDVYNKFVQLKPDLNQLMMIELGLFVNSTTATMTTGNIGATATATATAIATTTTNVAESGTIRAHDTSDLSANNDDAQTGRGAEGTSQENDDDYHGDNNCKPRRRQQRHPTSTDLIAIPSRLYYHLESVETTSDEWKMAQHELEMLRDSFGLTQTVNAWESLEDPLTTGKLWRHQRIQRTLKPLTSGRYDNVGGFLSPINGNVLVKLQFDIHFASDFSNDCRNLYVKYKLLAPSSCNWKLRRLREATKTTNNSQQGATSTATLANNATKLESHGDIISISANKATLPTMSRTTSMTTTATTTTTATRVSSKLDAFNGPKLEHVTHRNQVALWSGSMMANGGGDYCSMNYNDISADEMHQNDWFGGANQPINGIGNEVATLQARQDESLLLEGSTITSLPDSNGRFHFACLEQVVLELSSRSSSDSSSPPKVNNKLNVTNNQPKKSCEANQIGHEGSGGGGDDANDDDDDDELLLLFDKQNKDSEKLRASLVKKQKSSQDENQHQFKTNVGETTTTTTTSDEISGSVRKTKSGPCESLEIPSATRTIVEPSNQQQQHESPDSHQNSSPKLMNQQGLNYGDKKSATANKTTDKNLLQMETSTGRCNYGERDGCGVKVGDSLIDGSSSNDYDCRQNDTTRTSTVNNLYQQDGICEIILLFEVYSSDFYRDKFQGWSHLSIPIDLKRSPALSSSSSPSSLQSSNCRHQSNNKSSNRQDSMNARRRGLDARPPRQAIGTTADDDVRNNYTHALHVLRPALCAPLDRLRYYLTGQLPHWLPSIESFVKSNRRYLLQTEHVGKIMLDCEITRQFSDPNFDSALWDLLDVESNCFHNHTNYLCSNNSSRGTRNNQKQTSRAINRLASIDGLDARPTWPPQEQLDVGDVLEAYKRAKSRIDSLNVVGSSLPA